MKEDSAAIAFITEVERASYFPEYRKFVEVRRRNLCQLIQNSEHMWRSFQVLDDVLQRELDDLRMLSDEAQMIPLMLIAAAFGQMRWSMELLFSAATTEACILARSAIENVSFARKLLLDPQLIPVFKDRFQSGADKTRFKTVFTAKRKHVLFNSDPELQELYWYWAGYSNLNTHSNIKDVALRFEDFGATERHHEFGVHLFERSPKILAMTMFSVLRAYELIENLIHKSFHARLSLDFPLQQKREKFVRYKEQVRKETVESFGLSPNYAGLPLAAMAGLH